MSALSIQPTYPIFTDIDGQPLESGYIWIGTVNLNPITNPINVYWDAALTQPAAQPIRTVSGYPSNAGTPARLYVNSDYSIQVQNKNSTVVYSAPTATERYSDAVISAVNAEDVIYDPPFTAAVQTNVEAKLAETVSVKDFGAVGDGIANDRQAFIDAIAASNSVYVPPGTYLCVGGGFGLKDNFKLFGAGSASIIKLGTSGTAIGITDIDNVTVEDLVIDGGGQTTNIYTGVPAGNGLSIYGPASNVKINRVTAQNMGIINQANPLGVFPTYDIFYSGFGFIVSARTGLLENIRITNCVALNIAGVGYQKGDGFYVEGYGNFGGGITKTDVVIENCYASTCGRHCYTVAGGETEDYPSGVVFNNCYGEKSGLDGCDIETGFDVILNNCIWRNCGNDQTYSDPVATFGATFRLLAAIAVDNECERILIDNNIFEDCYYGFTYGASKDVVISNCIFRNSTVSDLDQTSLGQGIQNFRLVNCSFETDANAFTYYRAAGSDHGVYVAGCSFAGKVFIIRMNGGVFEGCSFKKGIEFTGSSVGSEICRRTKIVNCTFTDFAGTAILTGSQLARNSDFLIDGNVFIGTGNLEYGIYVDFDSIVNWIITNNHFIGLTNSGIYVPNAASGTHLFDACGNNFESCANGIFVVQAITQSIFANNSFGNISNHCIRIEGITVGDPMLLGPSIMNNMARNGCVNGVSIALNGGSYDYTMLVGNNVHACSGIKWSLAAGNANGVVANNITT